VSLWDNCRVLRRRARLGLVMLPVVFGWLGDLYATRVWHPFLLDHSCPAAGADCFYHPLLVAGLTWTALGALIGVWAAVTLVRGPPSRARRFGLTELIVVTPITAALLWWGHRFGMQQGGAWSDFDRFASVVLGAAVVRVAVGATRAMRARGRATSETASVAAAV
jgi:hypothetical protein